MTNTIDRERLDIVIAGHVDHGKSTVLGRLLADIDPQAQCKLQQIHCLCQQKSKAFEYAFLIDALKDEQSQGITIDTARVFLSTPKRDYVISDTPGHVDFLKNMITGASRAEAALLVIDASEGVQENSRRHGYLLSMLGIRQMTVLVNKMDIVQYSQEAFYLISEEYKQFLRNLNYDAQFVPVSGVAGDNITASSEAMPWYSGPTMLDVIDGFVKDPPAIDKPFRMPVQDVYNFTGVSDSRRTVVGTIETGIISVGDEVVFYPSKRRSTIKSIEGKPSHCQRAYTGEASAFTLDKQVYITRGEIAARADQVPPEVTKRFRVSLFWLGHEPMLKNKPYWIKVGTTKQQVELENMDFVIDGADLSANRQKDYLENHDIGVCILKARHTIAFDLPENIAITSRFVIVDDYEICGGGIITDALPDYDEVWLRDTVVLRDAKWESSDITRRERAGKYHQQPALVLLTGRKDIDKKTLAKTLESTLFANNYFVYFLGIGNILYGLDADIKTQGPGEHRAEHLRRMAEISNIMLDAGMILVVTASDLSREDLNIIEAIVSKESIYVIWVGDQPSDIRRNLKLDVVEPVENNARIITKMLQEKGVVSQNKTPKYLYTIKNELEHIDVGN